MGARGRRSADELAVRGAVALVERPDPPLDLTPQQAEEWQKITSALPAEWFSPENHALLAQYCRHTVDARRIAQLIDQECARGDMEIATYTELLKAQRVETVALKTLAASMRLAQQARYRDRGADAAKRGTSRTVSRPWDG